MQRGREEQREQMRQPAAARAQPGTPTHTRPLSKAPLPRVCARSLAGSGCIPRHFSCCQMYVGWEQPLTGSCRSEGNPPPSMVWAPRRYLGALLPMRRNDPTGQGETRSGAASQWFQGLWFKPGTGPLWPGMIPPFSHLVLRADMSDERQVGCF